jgi:hypothetical protein
VWVLSQIAILGAKSKNWVAEIQPLTDFTALEKANLRQYPERLRAVTQQFGDGAMGRIAAPYRWCWLGLPSAATTRQSDWWNFDASALTVRRIR